MLPLPLLSPAASPSDADADVALRVEVVAEMGIEESGAAGQNGGRHSERLEPLSERERDAHEGFTAEFGSDVRNCGARSAGGSA